MLTICYIRTYVCLLTACVSVATLSIHLLIKFNLKQLLYISFSFSIILSSSGVKYKCSVDKGGLEYYPAFLNKDNTGNLTCLPNTGNSIGE